MGEINRGGGGQGGAEALMSNAALGHVTPEYIDDGKHESAFMKILSRAGRC